MGLRWRVWNVYRHRVLAAVFGAISDALEGLHERLHPNRITYYRCEMCEDAPIRPITSWS